MDKNILNEEKMQENAQENTDPILKEPINFANGNIVYEKYRIVGFMGQDVFIKSGQFVMAQVYLANETETEHTYVIKRIRKRRLVDYETVKENAKKDFALQKKCDYRGIASVIEFLEAEDEFAIVSDHIEGKNLNFFVNQIKEVSEGAMVALGIQVCSALGYLHSRRKPLYFGHTDPSNIVIKTTGEVVLINTDETRPQNHIPVNKEIGFGVLPYQAPEQYEGFCDERTDIYNLGMTFYHALTGYKQLASKCDPEPIRNIRPELSEDIEKVIAKCVEKDPKNRYRSIDKLKKDLKKIAAKNARRKKFAKEVPQEEESN